MLDMTLERQCEDCGSVDGPFEEHPYPHADGYDVMLLRCVDRKGCAVRAKAERRSLAADCLTEIRDHRDQIKYLRERVKDAEAEMARSIQEALRYGAGPTAIARAAGLSRERIYQIRDGRR